MDCTELIASNISKINAFSASIREKIKNLAKKQLDTKDVMLELIDICSDDCLDYFIDRAYEFAYQRRSIIRELLKMHYIEGINDSTIEEDTEKLLSINDLDVTNDNTVLFFNLQFSEIVGKIKLTEDDEDSVLEFVQHIVDLNLRIFIDFEIVIREYFENNPFNFALEVGDLLDLDNPEDHKQLYEELDGIFQEYFMSAMFEVYCKVNRFPVFPPDIHVNYTKKVLDRILLKDSGFNSDQRFRILSDIRNYYEPTDALKMLTSKLEKISHLWSNSRFEKEYINFIKAEMESLYEEIKNNICNSLQPFGKKFPQFNTLMMLIENALSKNKPSKQNIESVISTLKELTHEIKLGFRSHILIESFEKMLDKNINQIFYKSKIVNDINSVNPNLVTLLKQEIYIGKNLFLNKPI